MTRFVVDCDPLLRIAAGEVGVAAQHQLVAPTLVRSQALAALYEAARRGEISVFDGLERVTRINSLRVRFLGDKVLQRQAWKVADELGWESTYDAEYVALTKLQADAFVTADPDFPDFAPAYFFLGNSLDNLWKPSKKGDPENDKLLEDAVKNYQLAADKLGASENPDFKKYGKLALQYLVAAYGAAMRGKVPGYQSNSQADAQKLLTGIFGNVKALDKSANDSFKNFESGNGDVAITYENQALAGIAAGSEDQFVIPPSTGITCPVVFALASPASQQMAFAQSCGRIGWRVIVRFA
jgi:predicted nucleic acid-binding protein